MLGLVIYSTIRTLFVDLITLLVYETPLYIGSNF